MSDGKSASAAAPVESLPRAVVGMQDDLSRCESVGELLAVLARGLRPLLPVTDRVSLVFVEPDGETMRIYRVLPALDEPPSPLPRVRIEGTPVGRTVREAVGRVVDDVRSDPNITFGHASRDQIRSTLSAPIRVGGRVVGALNAGSKIPGTCDERMLQELEELVSIVGPTVYAAERVIAEAHPPAASADAPTPAMPPPTARAPDDRADAGFAGRSPAFRAVVDAAGAASEDATWPTLEDHQRSYIVRVLEVCGGIIEGPRGAARLLGVRPSTLRSRMQKLGISADPMRGERRST